MKETIVDKQIIDGNEIIVSICGDDSQEQEEVCHNLINIMEEKIK